MSPYATPPARRPLARRSPRPPLVHGAGLGRGARLAAILGLALSLVVATSAAALADGSRTLYPANATCQPNSASGSCRASLEWRTNTYGPAGSQIFRRTIVTVFAQAGELLELGSSAVGIGAGEITVWNPGEITDQQAATLPAVTSGTNGFLCTVQRTATAIAAQGQITSRAQELAGPQSADGTGNLAGYIPCTYAAPTTGLYNVAFYGTAGPNVAVDGGVTADINLAAAANFTAAQGSAISAWDVTVRATAASVTNITGRSFTYALAEFTGGNGRPVNSPVYVTTEDGYRYRLDTRGLDPNGFIMFGSQTGFLDPNGSPLNHDILGTSGGATLATTAGNTAIAPPTFPISFTPLAAETLVALGIPALPIAPALSLASYSGDIGANNSTLGGGGTFHFTGNVAGNYEIVISRDGVDFDPGNPNNRVLLGLSVAGVNTITWNGQDNSGVDLPIGNGYAYHVSLHAGEYHFPMVDAESSTLGGPTFTLLNPPGGTCPFGRATCTTAFYDDRGYTTSDGTDVGTPGTVLCGTAPPATTHSDPLTGFDSAGAQRAFGLDTGGNTNASCTGAFGDVKGLDTWTYFPSTLASSTLNVIGSPPPGPTATDDSGTVVTGSTLTVPATGILGNDTGTGITVTANTTPTHGTTTVNADGSYSYTPTTGFSGLDTFDYTITDSLGRTVTATVTILVTPLATPDATSTLSGVPVTINPIPNDVGTGLTVTTVGQPPVGEGSIAIVGGQVVYTPPPTFVGVVTVPYTVTDTNGSTASSTITITVTSPLPTVTPDSGTTPANTPLVVPGPGVLSNDVGVSLTVTSFTQPTHGTVTVAANGSYTYTPATNYSGPDSYTYTVTDAAGHTASTTVTLDVTPRALPDHATTPINTPVTLHPLANDIGLGLQIISVTQPPAGTGSVSIVGTTVVYTPATGFTGTITYTYTIQDAAGHLATAVDTVVVTGPVITGGPGLPHTGAEVLPQLLAALSLLLSGCVLLLALRRIDGRP